MITPIRARQLVRRLADLAPAYARILRFPRNAHAPRHSLPGNLIVSLTSYPGRFGVVSNTLKSLLDQTVKPDRTVLWVAEGDFPLLPDQVLRLKDHGLEVLPCKDLRSFNKIIPTLERWPESFVITADDDLYYEPDWLKSLTESFDPAAPAIICRRAHVPTRDSGGRMQPYLSWDNEISMPIGTPALPDLFPTGAGGVLYFPGALAATVTDRAAIQELCPHADDVWLYWMGRMAGSSYRQIGEPFKQISWLRSQRTSLRVHNVERHGNDQQIRSMEHRFGLY